MLRNSLRVAQRRGYFQVSRLKNGLRVATSDTPGHFSALGMYVSSGSRYETGSLKGCTHIVDRLAFKSTKNIDARSMMETLELLGGNYQCTSSRESMMYQASVFNRDVEKMLNLLAETIRFPKITEEELQEQKFTAQYEIDNIWTKPDLILPELLHNTAYSGETLGSPLICPREILPSITKKSLLNYREKFYNPENTVAAFVGQPHEKSIELAEKYLGDWTTTGEPLDKTAAHYTGGETCIPSAPVFGTMPELMHIQIGFEGLPIDHPDIYALATLQTLLGGGGSFSAGGPGKGMYSRLYTHVLNQYYFVENCVSFNHAYSDSGIFGISLSCIPQAAPQAAEVIAQQFYNCFANGALRLTDAEVSRAKNQLKSSLLMNLESKLVELEDMGRQVLMHGKKIPVSEMVSKIESLTTKDISRVAEMVFTGKAHNKGNGTGRATIVMQGDRAAFGDVQEVLGHYGLGSSSFSTYQSKSSTTKLKWF